MDIRCRKTECKFNDRYTCKAKSILIGESDLCYTFEQSGERKRDASKNIFRKIPQYAPQRDTNKMKIECQNNCLFNTHTNTSNFLIFQFFFNCIVYKIF